MIGVIAIVSFVFLFWLGMEALRWLDTVYKAAKKILEEDE